MADEYQLDILASARYQLREIISNAAVSKRQLLRAGLDAIVSALRDQPLNFGEQLYDLKKIGVRVVLGVKMPLAVQFGVDEVHRLVVIQSFYLLGG